MSLETPFEILGFGTAVALIWFSGFVGGKWLKFHKKEEISNA